MLLTPALLWDRELGPSALCNSNPPSNNNNSHINIMSVLKLFYILTSATLPFFSTSTNFFEDETDRPIWIGRHLLQHELGYDQLHCSTGNHLERVIWNNDSSHLEERPAECCACRAIVDHFEYLLQLQVARLPEEWKHAVPTSWRLEQHGRSAETVPFSRHMDLILHVMPNACYNVSLGIPAEETRVDKVMLLLEKACDDLFEQFEDQIGHAFFNNFSSQTDTICGDEIVAACSDFVLEYDWVEVEDGWEEVSVNE